MQIMRFNSTRRFKTSISHQHNLSFYSKGWSMMKTNTNMVFEKLNAQRQKINDFLIIYHGKKQAHSLMK
jgi:hypothetical protein